jgi:hypothetical protein
MTGAVCVAGCVASGHWDASPTHDAAVMYCVRCGRVLAWQTDDDLEGLDE